MSKENNIDQADYIQSLHKKIDILTSAFNDLGMDVKASKKKRFLRKTQFLQMGTITRALCVDTVDPMKEHRVRFFHPMLNDPSATIKSLPFARCVSAFGGIDDCGLTWVPPAGSQLMIFFENGNKVAPYYLGTCWYRSRGPDGQDFGYPVQEHFDIYSGHRGGYLVGPDDESQVFPPWNTENYNGKDMESIKEFIHDPLEQQRETYPNIYGFKTPEKHMMKMVDGNAKCNRRWKRIEFMSGCGNWMIFKDDHLHYGGQWAHPSCPPDPGGDDLSLCATDVTATNFLGQPIEKEDSCDPCDSDGSKVSCSQILGGHPRTPSDPQTKYYNSQGGANKYFKHQNECRPYKGPGTPQNNKCDLPQSGIQILSIGGHSFVMDDSVMEPRGKPIWERSLEPFDWGCNNVGLGRMYVKSMTGHKLMFSDIEDVSCNRGPDNFVELSSANGNSIQLNDHTICPDDQCCIPCPPKYAGSLRGIHMKSTSDHQINLVDDRNLQCGPARAEGGVPSPQATQAYMQFRSGYGIEMRFNDDNSQQDTQSQWMQITHPQCVDPQTDEHCNQERGPHFLRFQGRPQGSPGIVMLRAGGHAIRSTYDMDIVLVGDKEKNPSDKFTYVSKMHIRATEDVDFRYTGQLHILFAEKYILLMAGRDCQPPEGKKCCGPCLYPVIVGKCPVICPLTNIVHWTEKAMSERVFASAKNTSDGCHGTCPPGGEPQPCTEEDSQQNIQTGSGSSDQQGGQSVMVGGEPDVSSPQSTDLR